MSFSSRLREELVWLAADAVFVALAVLLAPVAVALWAAGRWLTWETEEDHPE